MSTLKKTSKSTYIPEDLSDFINESQFLNGSPKNKKQPKRKLETVEKEIINFVGLTNTNKKKKVKEETQVCGEPRQKILNVTIKQLKTRSHINDNLLKSLSEVIAGFEADYNVLKENEQKLENFTGACMKCVQQATAASKQKLKALQEIHSTFKKGCEETEAVEKANIDKLGDEIEDDMNKLKQKLISETKRSGWENLQRSFMQAMQKDLY